MVGQSPHRWTSVNAKLSCKSIGCSHSVDPQSGSDFCSFCRNKDSSQQSLSARYPKNFKPVGDVTELDVFAVNQMFQVQDTSGCLQHAIGRLLLAGSRSTIYADILEARDTLTRWLQLNQEDTTV